MVRFVHRRHNTRDTVTQTVERRSTCDVVIQTPGWRYCRSCRDPDDRGTGDRRTRHSGRALHLHRIRSNRRVRRYFCYAYAGNINVDEQVWTFDSGNNAGYFVFDAPLNSCIHCTQPFHKYQHFYFQNSVHIWTLHIN
ncbi:hypothetical protein [Fodinicola feengrottensis]|uniref:hypothetical protein n=1 Tax=Fodinicola feengrottensis TaxID=435914 RepID=UPI0013D527F1|nr:hypothetical protein [Fodinicola feengrottensis]